MRISKIDIQNFRQLKNTSIDLEEDLSLVIGKNNSGKTSLLLIMDKFLGEKAKSSNFAFDDYNLQTASEFRELLISTAEIPEDLRSFSIAMTIFVEYDESDDLSNIGNTVIMDLDPLNKTFVLDFEYRIEKDNFLRARSDFNDFCERKDVPTDKRAVNSTKFIEKSFGRYFVLRRRSVLFDTNGNKAEWNVSYDLLKNNIDLKPIIQFRTIGARRDVSNRDADQVLSSQIAKGFKRKNDRDGEEATLEDFRDSLSKFDGDLDGLYQELFEKELEDISKFGGVESDEVKVSILSSLNPEIILRDNAKVKYKDAQLERGLPESYNGLGYLNLLNMIFELQLVLETLSATNEKRAADINILFIEEPEAHTHPQLQYIFIKNIKQFLDEKCADGGINLQTVISTHSAHIVAECEFDDIKYLKKVEHGTQSLNLSKLEEMYADDLAAYRFLKQYLTLNRAELFFAEKAIFIEGDTERILLPKMIAKLDEEVEAIEIKQEQPLSLPLKSQNVSIVEVGNYFQKFQIFAGFLGIKCLVITDLDGVHQPDGQSQYKACMTSDATRTSNACLNSFFTSAPNSDEPLDFKNLKTLAPERKYFEYCTDCGQWIQSESGSLNIVFQIEEKNAQGKSYHGRSFEDAFIHLNKDFISRVQTDGNQSGNSLFPSFVEKHIMLYREEKIDAYELADKGILSKPSFAIELLLYEDDQNQWETPKYIQDGLKWLRSI